MLGDLDGIWDAGIVGAAVALFMNIVVWVVSCPTGCTEKWSNVGPTSIFSTYIHTSQSMQQEGEVHTLGYS